MTREGSADMPDLTPPTVVRTDTAAAADRGRNAGGLGAGSTLRAGQQAGAGTPRVVTVLVAFAGFVITIAGVQAFAGSIGPAFLALVLVITVYPVQARLQRLRVPGWLGVLVVVLLVYLILLSLIAALAYAVAELSSLLPAYSTQFSDLLDDATGLLRDLGVKQDQLQTALGQVNLSRLVGPVQQVLGSVAGVLSDLAFVVALVLFLAMEATGFTRRSAAAARLRPDLFRALSEFAHSTRRYIAVSTVFGLLVAAIDVAALYWLAVPLPLLWGLFSFITNYIPNVGFVLGLIPPALLALLEHGPGRAGLVVVAYSVINLVFQSAIQPKVVGDSVGLSVTLTFGSLVFWSFVIGPLGAVLAVPLTLFVKALLVDADPAASWLQPLLAGTDNVSPDDSDEEAAAGNGTTASAGQPYSVTERTPGG